jgi:AcrR family transcriptional regulator
VGGRTKLTPKGLATRARIVEVAADLVLARGAGGTSLDDIRARTSTSKSQLFHYFPRGKAELVSAIATFQAERVLAAQQPFLDTWTPGTRGKVGGRRFSPTPAPKDSGVVPSAAWRTKWQEPTQS